KVILPKIENNCTHVWHLFVLQVEKRDTFMEYLNKNGIESIIHYPIPPHLSEAYAYLGYKKGSFNIAENYSDKVVSIPLFIGMEDEEVSYIIKIINEY
ncbi:DegT/DnrJ/EryC1/StrS family aminotransferase, partial [Clostridioides difficile]|uniref:DegT/DnrJ/EryC1/StrS family aminotransferase n=1 Tax=Clostridioides difficile TaxID=1496 RepID=UPI001CA55D98